MSASDHHRCGRQCGRLSRSGLDETGEKRTSSPPMCSIRDHNSAGRVPVCPPYALIAANIGVFLSYWHPVQDGYGAGAGFPSMTGRGGGKKPRPAGGGRMGGGESAAYAGDLRCSCHGGADGNLAQTCRFLFIFGRKLEDRDGPWGPSRLYSPRASARRVAQGLLGALVGRCRWWAPRGPRRGDGRLPAALSKGAGGCGDHPGDLLTRLLPGLHWT